MGLTTGFDGPARAAGNAQLATSTATITTASGAHAYRLEWAVTDAEQETGLMFRTSMARDAGMVFDFGQDGMRYFWMRNTYIPLDMIFVDAGGTVRHVFADAKPRNEDIISSKARVRYVIELNGGEGARIKLAVGDRVHLVRPSSP